MTNKTKAIVMANKALRQENRALWDENDLLRKADEEMKAMYEAMIRQLVQLAGGEVTLPKMDVKALMEKYRTECHKNEDGSVTLRVLENEVEDDGEEH